MNTSRENVGDENPSPPVRLVPYDPRWPSQFELERRELERILIQCLLALFLATASACNDTSSAASTANAATHAELEGVCAALCARTARCNASGAAGEDAGINCTANCLAGFGGLGASLRSDVVRGLERCYMDLACGMNDDRCTADALAGAGESVDAAIHSPDVERCLSKYQECKGTPAAFTDDECGVLPILVEERRQALAQCFDGSCAAVAPCLKSQTGS